MFPYTEGAMGSVTAHQDQNRLLEVEPTKLHSTKVTLPLRLIDSVKVGKNRANQIYQDEELVDVDVYDEGDKLLKLKSEKEEFILKLPGARATITNKNVLRIANYTDAKSINQDSKLTWEDFQGSEAPNSTNGVKESWLHSFNFKEEYPAKNIPGLRKPQAGAIHSVAAHWSVKNDCATIVMPTGIGKTETMLSVMVHQQCEKILVLVPTSALRKQIYNKFLTLGKLKKLGVVEQKALSPRVLMIEHTIENVAEAKEVLKNANVIVATVSVLNRSSDTVKQVISEGCSHLFIDEAHHVPANSWSAIKDLFENKYILQFTATPFRRDSKVIEGDIIYNYPLGMAQNDGYFKKINLLKLQEFDDAKSDEEIAKAAIGALENDLNGPIKLDHMIMARCKDKDRARDIIRHYKKHGTTYNPVLIDSELTSKQYREIEEKLKNGETRIIVCVNMLGEGFDLPNLKIAALHDVHKSLAITLQFIGRFTREAKDVGDATVVVNVNDPQVNKDLEGLYSENPDWNEILKQKSESTIEHEIESHEFIKEFSGELSKHISLWNLRPSFSTLIYETKCQDWNPKKFEEVMPKRYKYWHAINQKEKILVVVISKEDEVNWGRYKDIHNHSFELCVVHWSEEHKALFIQSSDYDAINPAGLSRAICGEDTKIKNGSNVFNIYSGVERILARNLGISTVGNNISYTMHFGSDITQGLSKLDKSLGVLNNISAWGFEGGDRFMAGCSERSGKIWSIGGGPMMLWKSWCHKVADKVFDETIEANKVIEEFLRPVQLEKRHKSVPLLIEWSERILKAKEDNITVLFGKEEFKIYDVEIEITNFSDSGPVHFRVFNDTHETKYKIDYSKTDCKYSIVSGNDMSIKKYSAQPVPFMDYVLRDPVVVIYVDGSFSYNNYHVPTPPLNQFYDKERLQVVDWQKTNIRVESMKKERKTDSIQHKVWQMLNDEYEVVFNDDDSGEAADLIAIRQESTDTIKLHLVHCKFSSKPNTGSRIGDFYALCGQAQKSIKWKHNGLDYLCEHMKHRNEAWEKTKNSRFLKGSVVDLNKLKKFSRFATNFVFEVTVVQPGLSKAKISDDVIQLLGSTEDYLLKTSNASFNVFCSK